MTAMTAEIEIVETEAPTATVSASDLHVVRDRIEKANRRLERAGVTERFELVVGEGQVVEQYNDETGQVETRYFEHEVSLVVPSIGYNGWRFMATLSFEEGGTVVRTVPGVELNDYRPADKVCDQCGTARERKETFVVRNAETGETKQVGRNCLALFFGLKPYLWVYELPLYDPEADRSSRGIDVESVRNIVAAALAVTDGGLGYLSQRAANDNGGEATSSATSSCLYEVVRGSREWDRERRAQLAAWRTEATRYLAEGTTVDAVIEATKAIEGEGDYAGNIRVLANSEWVSTKNIGFVASFVAVYSRAIQREVQRQVRAEREATALVSEFVATEGAKKVVTTGVVTGLRKIEGDYGTTLLVEWTTAQGEVCKWFSSNWYAWTEGNQSGVGATGTPFDLGTAITVTGTVKKHEIYNGRKATVFTRCTVEAA